jgi:23S rRNA (guanosine2251-2'-O)-methyltransferase
VTEPARGQVIYGRRPVEEAERGRRRVRRVWRAPEISAEELERLCGSPDHQGVVAEADPYPYADPNALLRREGALLVALDQVQDPRNLGAVCRSAEFAGAAGVVVPERRSAEVTAVVCKASAGAVEHLEVARVRNLADWLAEAKAAGFWIWGADAKASQPPWGVDLGGPTVLVLGGEGKGIRPRVASACDGFVALPSYGRVSSLNVSAAAAALLFEAARQRSSAGGAGGGGVRTGESANTPSPRDRTRG